MGIEPTTQAWEAHILPLNYIRIAQLYQQWFKNTNKKSHLFSEISFQISHPNIYQGLQ